jgi:hypothetical protein
MIAAGALIVLGAILAGPSRWALSVRRWLAPVLRERVWAYAALAVFALLLFTTGSTLDFARFVWIALLVLLAALWIETMRRRTRHEFPDAAMPAFVGEARARVSTWWSESRAAMSAPRPASPAPTADVAGRLASLADLHAKGELTDEEYASAKAQVLAGS